MYLLLRLLFVYVLSRTFRRECDTLDAQLLELRMSAQGLASPTPSHQIATGCVRNVRRRCLAIGRGRPLILD